MVEIVVNIRVEKVGKTRVTEDDFAHSCAIKVNNLKL